MNRMAAILRHAALFGALLAAALVLSVGATAQPEPDVNTTTETTTATTTETTTTTTTEPTTTTPTTTPEEPPPAEQPPPAESEPPQPDTPPASSSGGLIAALIAALVVIVVLVIAVVLLLRRRSAQAVRSYVPQSAYTPHAQPAPPSTPVEDGTGRVADERDTLALTLIEVADAARGDAAQVARIHRGLERAGYHVIDPTGQPFDSRHHEGLHNRPTDDPAQQSVVAATVRPGYRRGNRVVRQPEVVVYQYTGGQGRTS